MKKSVLTGAVSILMAAALAFGAPVALAAEGEAPGAGPLDLEQPNSLTVKLDNAENFADDLDPAAPEEGETPEGGGTTGEPGDPLVAPAVVDLYLVAEAEKLPGSDGYTYDFGAGSFGELAEDFSAKIEGLTPDAAAQEAKASAWLDLAQEAAKFLFPEEGAAPEVTPAAKEQPLGEIKDLNAGLYLLVPHGAGLTPEQYVEYVPGLGPEAAASIVTKAFSELYAYSFTPYLVSLPGRNVEGPDTTGGNTADGSGWNYDVTTYLKVTQEPRYGQLVIEKGIDAYLDGWNASFVFEITAVKGEGEDAETVYSNVVSLDFNDGNRDKSVTLDRIPAGSTVTVTEVYSGASYTAEVPSVEIPVLSATELATASFTNNHNDRNSGGYGANNHFEYNEINGIPGWAYVQPEGGAEE